MFSIHKLGSTIFVLVLCCNSMADSSQFEVSSMDKRFVAGKDQIDRIQAVMTMSKLPRHGECWKSVLQDLQIGCTMLTDEIQSKIAFAFTSCFSEMLGLPPYLCESATPIKDCIRSLDQTGMNTFRDYFLHTQDMCFYIQHEMWQEETNKAVNELTNAANTVTKNVQDTHAAQEKILNSQHESLKVQSDLLKDNNALYNAVLKFKGVFDEFKHSADEHRLIFLEIFEKLSKMQTLVSWIQGEMSLLDTMGFYFACLVFGILATATRRSRHARFYIVLLLILCLAAERMAFSYLAEGDDPVSPDDLQIYIWYIRRTAAILGILILVVTAANYRDLQVMNSNMLLEMNSQMHQLLQFVEELQKKIPASNNRVPMKIKSVPSNNDEDDTLSVSSKSSLSGTDCSDSFSNYSTDTEDSLDDFEVQDAEINHLGSKILRGIENVPQGNPISSSTPNGSSSYNLRTRKPVIHNPLLESEGASEFARIVRLSRQTSTIQNHSLNYYSSDEELL